MLEASKSDGIVKDLLIKSGKTPPDSLRTVLSNTVYTIPVLFHLFTNVENGATVGNVPAAAFQKQIEVMNSAFQKTGIKFSLYSVKTYTNSPYFRSCDTSIQ